MKKNTSQDQACSHKKKWIGFGVGIALLVVGLIVTLTTRSNALAEEAADGAKIPFALGLIMTLMGIVIPLVGSLPEKQGMPVLCAAADFNMTDPMPFLEVSGKPYRDLFHGEVTRPYGRKTDGILISDPVKVTELLNITPPEEQGQQIMDHHFILAELEF